MHIFLMMHPINYFTVTLTCLLKCMLITNDILFAASMIGLDTMHSQVLSGDQIDSMSDMQLEQIVSSVTVFYRVTPRHKLCIVKVNSFLLFWLAIQLFYF